jgi:hypothetical protein
MATQQDLVDAAVEVADGWRLRGRWADGAALLRGVQPAAVELGAAAGARVLVALARLLNDQSMFAGVRQPNERAAVLCTRAIGPAPAMACRSRCGCASRPGSSPGAAMVLAALAEVVAGDGQRQDAVALLGRAREILASLGAAEHAAWVDQQLAEVQAGQD